MLLYVDEKALLGLLFCLHFFKVTAIFLFVTLIVIKVEVNLLINAFYLLLKSG